jgi:mRNA-degrading endonuclease RelE of RelBE toxin-antitoxin system
MDQEISPSARDDLGSLPDEAADRLLSKFEDAAEWPDHYLTRLTGNPYYKLRARLPGNYRLG